MERIGTLRFLRRYPVKGMKGEDLGHANVTRSGVAGDRVFAFVDEKSPEKEFPWMTARQKHEMILFRPRFLDGSSFRMVEVLTPEGERFRLPDEEFENFLETRFGYDLTLKFEDSGIKDSHPLSLIALQTIEALKAELGIDLLRHERFRANFYADWRNRKPFFEDDLIGRSLKIGEQVVIKLEKKDSRCVVPTLDTENARSSPEILKKIQQNHKGCIGVYAVTEKEGYVNVEDPIYLQ